MDVSCYKTGYGKGDFIMAAGMKRQDNWEKILKESDFISKDDCIEEYNEGIRWNFPTQTKGNYFLTKEKIIFIGEIALGSFTVSYKDIKAIKKKAANLFSPECVSIVTADASGKKHKYYCFVEGKEKWLTRLSNKVGFSCA